MYQPELQTAKVDFSVDHPRMMPNRYDTKILAAEAGDDDVVLERLTPMAYNTSTGQYDVWATGGANGLGTIVAFVGPDAGLQVSGDTNKVDLLVEGQVDARDIPVIGGTAAQLKVALGGTGLRALNINVMEVDSVA